MLQKGQQMLTTQIKVTSDFLNHRAEKEAMYNKRGRDHNRFLMDLDCEIYEWYKIDNGEWQPHKDWRVDAQVYDPTNEYTRRNLYDSYDDKSKSFTAWCNVDVKFIKKWYNISNTKMLNFVKQHNIVDLYIFMEWVEEYDRPLQEGDTVEVRPVGQLSYTDLANLIQVSRGKWGGFYADVRSAV